jgi:toxin ParE1/3/4
MNIEFLDIAVEEMEQASVYYEQQNKGLGTTFLASISDAVKRLEQFPESGALASRTVRRLLVSTFPYGIYYRIDRGNLVIIAVGRLRRKSGFWKGR